MRILCVLLSLMCLKISTSQQDKAVDSIMATLSALSIEERIEVLEDLCYSTSTTDFDSSLFYGTAALNLAKHVDDDLLLGKSLKNLANTHMRASRFETAINLNKKAIDHFKSINNQLELSGVYNNLGVTYRRKGDFDKALEHLFKSLKIKDSLGGINLTSAYANIGQVYRQKGELEKALTYFFRSLEIDKKNDDQSGMAINYSNIGTAYENQGSYDSALYYSGKALAIDEKLNDRYGIAIDYNNMAEAHLGKKEYPVSLDYYHKSLAIKEDMGNKNGLTHTYQRLAKLYLDWEKYDSALVYAHKSLSILEAVGNKERKMKTYDVLSEIYLAKQDYKNAINAFKEYQKFKDTIFDIEKERLVTDFESKYESAQKDGIIELQKTTIAGQQKAKMLFGILSGLLLIILTGLYHNYNKRKKSNKELRELHEALGKKNAQNELLLKEIHHRVKNNLEMVKSLISLQSAHLEDSKTRDAMLASQNRVQSMGIIHQKLYQGDSLGSIEMKDYFINLSEGILDSFNAEERIKIECVMDKLELDIDTAVPLGLIVNELLTNAIKYAFPKNFEGVVQVSLSKDNDSLRLDVNDNGIGKRTDPTTGTGFGSQLVQLLTAQLNGKMEEEVKDGTHISFTFKLETAA